MIWDVSGAHQPICGGQKEVGITRASSLHDTAALHIGPCRPRLGSQKPILVDICILSALKANEDLGLLLL